MKDKKEDREFYVCSLLLDAYILRKEAKQACRVGLLSGREFKAIIKTLAEVKRAARLIGSTL